MSDNDPANDESIDEQLQAALKVVAREADSYAADLMDFVRVPSISTEDEHRPDIDAAASWVAARLWRAGFTEVRSIETPGFPVVHATLHHDPALPTVIVYGHYDVQPVEPLELWDSPPFEPEIRDGKVYGRGASDDKAGVLTAIQAVEAYTADGGLPPVNLTFLIEGEEEIGSPNLADFLEQHREILRADLAISADGGIHGVGIPSLTIGSRGLAAVQLDVKGAAGDLHSGMYGGAVANPLAALAKIIATFHDENGVVQVEGFYDDVAPLEASVREAIAAQPGDEAAELAALDIASWWGDPDYSAAERRSVRPTLEINGIGGGFQGAGIKTVLPNTAFAKISCRLVVDQDPEKVVKALQRHVAKVTPPGVTATVTALPGNARAYQMPISHPALEIASRSLAAVYDLKAFPVWTGGTVPVAEQFRSILGTWCLYFAFGEPDNALHAPNEFYRVITLRQGTEATVRLFAGLAGAKEALAAAN